MKYIQERMQLNIFFKYISLELRNIT